MNQPTRTAAASHWRRRANFVAMPHDQIVRQGNITRLAFILLGKEAAIAFLNAECPELDGRPLALATASDAGETKVRAKLKELVAIPAGDAAVLAG